MKNQAPATPPKIHVKVMATIPTPVLRHQLPGNVPEWGNCLFSFDPEDTHYDWLVVYDDLPARRAGIVTKS